MIDGVRTVVVWDRDWNQGQPVEAGLAMRVEPRVGTPGYSQAVQTPPWVEPPPAG